MWTDPKFNQGVALGVGVLLPLGSQRYKTSLWTQMADFSPGGSWVVVMEQH